MINVTTWISGGTRIHALDTSHAPVTVCGRSTVHYGRRIGVTLRTSDIGDAYVTCQHCSGMLAKGQTLSRRTVARRKLQAQLSTDTAGTLR